MSGRHADLRIRIGWTQLSPVPFGGRGGRLRFTPIDERKLWIHLLNLGGGYDLQSQLIHFPPDTKPISTQLPTFIRGAMYAAP